MEVYGATETGIVTYTPLDEEPASGSCGKANTSTYQVAVVDDEDNILPSERSVKLSSGRPNPTQ